MLYMCVFVDCLTSSHGHQYTGHINHTMTGLTCKRWELFPHYNNIEIYMFPDFVSSLDDVQNYCRNPDDDSTTWCYAIGGWEFCDIPTCTGK